MGDFKAYLLGHCSLFFFIFLLHVTCMFIIYCFLKELGWCFKIRGFTFEVLGKCSCLLVVLLVSLLLINTILRLSNIAFDQIGFNVALIK